MTNIPHNTSNKNPLRDIQWPEDMRHWANTHEGFIPKIEESIFKGKHPLTIRHLWDIIAEHYSLEWREAKNNLTAAEKDISRFLEPENIPLGLIGRALASQETALAEDMHCTTLASFIMVDENLRQDKNLQMLLRTLQDHVSAIDTSLCMSFNPRARETESKPPSSLRKAFGFKPSRWLKKTLLPSSPH
jgi:hypothetical protein